MYAQGTDTTLITATFSDELLTAMEKGGDVSLTVSLTEHVSQRSFTSYTVPVHANTPPPEADGAMVCIDTNASPNTYVLCFNMPSTAKMGSSGIHGDITSLAINDTSYPLTVDSATGTGANDVYLASGTYITVSGELTAAAAAKIQAADCSYKGGGSTVLKGTTTRTLTSDDCSKFSPYSFTGTPLSKNAFTVKISLSSTTAPGTGTMIGFGEATVPGGTVHMADDSSWSGYYSGTNNDRKGVFLKDRNVQLSVLMGYNPCYTIVVNGSATSDTTAWGTVPTGTNTTWDAAVCDITQKGYRLPTEAEWEYAARGGNSSATEWPYKHSGSNTIDDFAWYSSNADSKTHEAGKKGANTLGLYDMSGNVWEWCWDWKNGDATYNDSNYTIGVIVVNPLGALEGTNRIQRGGYYNSSADDCSVSFRRSELPYSGNYYGGFRICRSQ